MKNDFSMQIKCPKCGHKFEITESLRLEIEKNYEEKYKQKLENDRKKMERELRNSLEKEIEKEVSEENKKLKKELNESKKKMSRILQKEAELEKMKRDLEMEKQKMEVLAQKKINREMEKIKKQVEETIKEQFLEKEKKYKQEMDLLKKKIEDLNKTKDMRLNKLDGTLQENYIEEEIANLFPEDDVLRVKSGQKGGDVIQTVYNNQKAIGKILWESKNTKNWADKWINKIKDDKRDAKADIAVIVTTSMPSGLKDFGIISGVFVVHIDSFKVLLFALRQIIFEKHRAKTLSGVKEKQLKYLYDYLISQEFVDRLETVFSTFKAMKEGIEKEKKVMTSEWAKREAEIEKAVHSMIEIYGTLQGKLSNKLPQMKELE